MVKEIQSSHTQCKLTLMNANDRGALQLVLFDKRMTMMGNVVISKFSYAHQDPSMEYTSNEGKGVHLHTLVDRERKRSNERG